MDKKEAVNWISTVIAIILGLSAIVGWFRQSGAIQANSENIAVQTQKQWELRQTDQLILAQIKQDIATLKTDMKWIEKGHKTVDMEVK